MFSDHENVKIEGIKDNIYEIETMLKALIKSLEKTLKPLDPEILDQCLPTNWENK